MCPRDPWSDVEGSRLSSGNIDGRKSSCSDMESSKELWVDIEKPRVPCADDKVSKFPREFSDALQASLVIFKVSDGSILRREVFRLCPEEGKCPRESWTDDEVSRIP